MLAEMRDIRDLPIDEWAAARDRTTAWAYAEARRGALAIYRDGPRCRVQTTVNESIAQHRAAWRPGNPIKRRQPERQ